MLRISMVQYNTVLNSSNLYFTEVFSLIFPFFLVMRGDDTAVWRQPTRRAAPDVAGADFLNIASCIGP